MKDILLTTSKNVLSAEEVDKNEMLASTLFFASKDFYLDVLQLIILHKMNMYESTKC